ncbi:hypothetical protein OG894_04905 [Streptomyces sp. NBC_01724]|uniref:DUF6624 domain-containing protein n=1 Tax=unclassified Streptomyces TaxID=2593676 RepID=UPI002E3524E8|nr:DUF6624 domain-containing protein [Streptomyces sp. NBC_01724]WTE55983.1 hypothetical protein OG987_37815 [Streptomyces sp. NBC_01620]WTE64057.1 hypothetical protein OG784_37555 [Streptomyces sp. NBC_01617]WTI91340.1 hypothetical protein OHB17_36875 [Streptomyces sp. NBC_00724]
MTTAEPLRPELARELITLAERSAARRAQRLRNQLDAVQLGRGRHADHASAKVLRRILADHDCWPGHRLVGPDAARAAWSIALHSNDEPDFQRAAAVLLRRAVQADDAPIQHWVHLHDRALINNRHDQELGTQFFLGANGIELCPTREPSTLDQRRAGAGLPPVAVALEKVRHRFASMRGDGGSPTVVLAGAA